jgi:hypothetical protein
MAYDPAIRLLLLFGGSSDRCQSPSVLSDTWAWNGTDRTQLRAVRLPTWMPGAPIAWSPAARQLTPRPGCPCSQPHGPFTTVPAAAGSAGGCGPGGLGPTTPSTRLRALMAGCSRRIHCPAGCRTTATPPAPRYGGPIPRDRTGTRYSQTWLWHDGKFTTESPSAPTCPGSPAPWPPGQRDHWMTCATACWPGSAPSPGMTRPCCSPAPPPVMKLGDPSRVRGSAGEAGCYGSPVTGR